MFGLDSQIRDAKMQLPENHQITNRRKYTFECPIGVWKGRLDGKAWGKQAKLRGSRVLNLYFSEIETAKKYAISIYWATYNGYSPAKGGVDFKVGAEPGECFELETVKATHSFTVLVAARKLESQAV
jgi:hypothetical protein